MSRSTETATGFTDDSATARQLAVAVCEAFATSTTKVAVVSNSSVLLAVSPGTPVGVGLAFANGSLDVARHPELARALNACFVAGARSRLEPGTDDDLLGPNWALECVPWDVPLAVEDQRAGLIPRSSGITRRVGLLIASDEGEALALRRRLEQVNRAESLGMLAGSVAHDFNNLLTGIRGSLALVRHHVSPGGRESALCAAEAAAQRAGDVTRRLLSFTRGPDHVAARAEPTAVLQETVELMRCMPDTGNVEVDIDQELGSVDMLPSELHQVVLNLLVNASDAVRSQGLSTGVMLRASTTWRARPEGAREASHWLRVSVIDQGPGMDPEVKRRIFEPFFTTKSSGNGTGLGLNSVMHLVQNAGGWLEVESEPERGSAFHVYLPSSPDPSAMPLESRQGAEPEVQPQVLICDDESRLGELTVGLLEEFGYSSRAVLQGEEALALMTGANPPSALLLDVNLSSGMSATALIEELESRHSAIPVILTSGLSVEDLPPELRYHPRVKCYLGKPYTVGELVSAISTALSPDTEEPAAESQLR